MSFGFFSTRSRSFRLFGRFTDFVMVVLISGSEGSALRMSSGSRAGSALRAERGVSFEAELGIDPCSVTLLSERISSCRLRGSGRGSSIGLFTA